MSKCPNCGADVREGAKFCESCGAKMEVESPRKSFCPQCGAEMPAGAAFCSACGYRVGDAVNAPQAQSLSNNQKPNGEDLTGPIGLIRCLLKNIAVFVAFVFSVLAFVVPMVEGLPGSYFQSLQQVLGSVSSGGGGSLPQGLLLVPWVVIAIVYFLPALGIVVFGTISIIDGIICIVKRKMPRYNIAGYMFAFAIPLHILIIGLFASLTGLDDIIGFSFLMFHSPSFVMVFVGLIVYLGVGVADNYLKCIKEKRPLTSPILRTVAAGVGVLAVICLFANIVCNYQSKVCTNAISYFSEGMDRIASNTADTTKSAMSLVPLLYGVLFLISAVFVTMGLADLFRTDGRKGFKINAIVFSAFSAVFGVLAQAMLCIMDEVPFILVIPSISGFILLAAVIAVAVLADAAANKEKAQ